MASEAAEVYEIPCGAISLLQALTKRQEHQQASWVCFLDLVRAFDTVNRQLLFDVASKMGAFLNL